MTGHQHSEDDSRHRHGSHVVHTSHVEHKAHAPRSIRCAVITCSDTRTPDTDTSGKLIQQLLKDNGHQIDTYQVMKDEPKEVQALIRQLASKEDVQAVIINGGTGISGRDSTFEAVDALLEKRLDGFGEIFRYLSYKEVGSPAMLSRATAGLFSGTILFSIPGSERAVRLAMEQLILPELGHIVGEITK